MISEEMIGWKRKRSREQIFLERFNELERENVITKLDVKHFRNYVAGDHSNCVSTRTCLPFIKFHCLYLTPQGTHWYCYIYPSHGRPFHKTFVCPQMIFACTSHNMRWLLSLNICLPITEYLFHPHKMNFSPSHNAANADIFLKSFAHNHLG